MKPVSFISFDVEALPGRAPDDLVNRLVWGKMNGGEYGIRRLCDILNQHRIKGNFLIDMALCALYGDKEARKIGDFLLEQGHELHIHLHSEWIVRQWNIHGKFNGPAGLDQLDSKANHAALAFSAFKFRQLFNLEPLVFRGGGYHFNAHTIAAAQAAGFKMLTNYNSARHQDSWFISDGGTLNEPFRWSDNLIEMPVDFSPEPLSFPWEKYQGYFDRVLMRKKIQTFNLTLHSWTLLRRENEYFIEYAPNHEDRLHEICDHLNSNTDPMGYAEYLAGEIELSKPAVSECHSIEVNISSELVECTVCGSVHGEKWKTDICPSCSARARHRQLFDVFSRLGNPFIGSRVLANYANSVEVAAFLGQASFVLNFDVRPVGEVDVQMDIQDMSRIEGGSFDAFLAMHVLNHVADDRLALNEIHRVLKPGGIAVLTIPYREGEPTTDYPNITEHYGEDALSKFGVGSYRRYGLRDVQALFGENFTVHAEPGFDPVTKECMKVFILKKPIALSGIGSS